MIDRENPHVPWEGPNVRRRFGKRGRELCGEYPEVPIQRWNDERRNHQNLRGVIFTIKIYIGNNEC